MIDYHLSVDQVVTVRRASTDELALLHTLSITPTHIPRYSLAFLLCCHTGKCNYHFHVEFIGIDIFILKINAYA